MITPVQPSVDKKPLRKQIVSYSGYSAMGLGTLCGVTALKSVKFPNKMKVHKYSAYLAGISTLLHFTAVKWKKQ